MKTEDIIIQSFKTDVAPPEGWEELEKKIIEKAVSHKKQVFKPSYILKSGYGILIEFVAGLFISGALMFIFIMQYTDYNLSTYIQLLKTVWK